MSSEIEFKFEIPGDRIQAVMEKLEALDASQVELRAHYFDTPDALLASKGVVLRVRQESPRWFQTVKVKTDGPLERAEDNIALGLLAEEPAPDITQYKNTPIGDLLGDLKDTQARLIPMFSTEITRRRCVIEHGRSQIEIALDVGQINLPDRLGVDPQSSPVRELEMELVEGRVSDLAVLAKEWLARHHLSVSTTSKDARGRRLLAGNPTDVAVKAAPVFRSKPKTLLRGDEIQRLVVSGCLNQILPNATEVAAGNFDRDVVHQLRVGIRRLRTALRELDDLHPGRLDSRWEAPLKQAFDALGKRRDWELLATKTQPGLEKHGSPEVDLGERPAGVALDTAVREPELQTALVELLAFCSSDTSDDEDEVGAHASDANNETQEPPVTAKAARKILAKRLNSLHKKMVKGGVNRSSHSPPKSNIGSASSSSDCVTLQSSSGPSSTARQRCVTSNT
ncbi:CYTH and CHAD domain-containing protein (plasmid) [Comamonadaceae bacterium OTU4NAUVB1]|nr:CYTH and CHAD domain-containing protein [Comamonadaceae bacterium OTU4NAUVB1]